MKISGEQISMPKVYSEKDLADAKNAVAQAVEKFESLVSKTGVDIHLIQVAKAEWTNAKDEYEKIYNSLNPKK